MFAYLLPATLIVSILFGTTVSFRLRRRSMASRTLFGLLGATLCLVGIWGGFVALFLVALFEPWPLSLRQGPDTEFSHECYERFVAPLPEHGITDVYCRDEWGFGGDSIRSLRFSFDDQAAIDAVVLQNRLIAVDPDDRSGFRYLESVGWWPQEAELRGFAQAYGREQREYLWVDQETGVAYFQIAGF